MEAYKIELLISTNTKSTTHFTGPPNTVEDTHDIYHIHTNTHMTVQDVITGCQNTSWQFLSFYWNTTKMCFRFEPTSAVFTLIVRYRSAQFR